MLRLELYRWSDAQDCSLPFQPFRLPPFAAYSWLRVTLVRLCGAKNPMYQPVVSRNGGRQTALGRTEAEISGPIRGYPNDGERGVCNMSVTTKSEPAENGNAKNGREMSGEMVASA
jgi:hypothetical protein